MSEEEPATIEEEVPVKSLLLPTVLPFFRNRFIELLADLASIKMLNYKILNV